MMQSTTTRSLVTVALLLSGSSAFQPATNLPSVNKATTTELELQAASEDATTSRRDWLAKVGTATAASAALWVSQPEVSEAVGPVKINLLNPTYTAIPCPKDKPIPGEKAMKGMKGLCVTVNVDLEESPKKDLELVGVYGFVTDRATGESVLANNPDLSTDAGEYKYSISCHLGVNRAVIGDVIRLVNIHGLIFLHTYFSLRVFLAYFAGQFAMVDAVSPKDNTLAFEFIAAVPRELDTSQFEAGIAPLDFASLRVISFPGGQQYGAVSPCEMNEFSDECEAWEEENGPYKRGEFMIKSNPRTKGR